METKPFIHLFKTSIGYYFFDVNTDSIVKVDENTYRKLQDYSNNMEDEQLKKMKCCGLLGANFTRETKHPETDFLSSYFKTYINTLLIQVTQNCNQRCSYCVYSGNYENRIHSNKRMNIGLAKKGIDFIIQHSKDATDLFFGFYGGEPLLEKELIKWCIQYIDNCVEGKKVNYNITTNATLLTEDIVKIFVQHNVSILISLDGPSDIHNRNRGFSNGVGNPFVQIIHNLKFIRKNYPDYYKEYISFNAVLNGKDNFEYIDGFFRESKLTCNNSVMSTLISNEYSKTQNQISEEFVEKTEYTKMLNMMLHIGRLDNSYSKLLELQTGVLALTRTNKQFGDRMKLPSSSHHSGNCIPGIQKLFMNVEGKFFPCERVSECSSTCNIGNIRDGVDIKKVKELLNIERNMETECHNCWAYEYCTMCLVESDDLENISVKKMKKNCSGIRREIEEKFKDYCVCEYIRKEMTKGEMLL